MAQIRVLEPHTANKIAAGEVVERPMSIVKELVENAIDAGANSITVEIKNGGISYIRVTDNGVGIQKEQCLLAFERHATSKISTAQDLEHIETLGFRGEALASIAAISKVTLKTKTSEQDVGYLVKIDGGHCKTQQPVACPDGTTFEVCDVFYNTPARLKFLKAPRTEAAYIGEYVSRMIMARPDIAIRFINNDTLIYQSTGNDSLKDSIYCIYGSAVLPHIKEIAFDNGYVKLTGYIGTPVIARPNRMQQSFFLNGRYIRSVLLSRAIQNAFDTRIMVGKYPFAVIKIQIASNEVDVNVHPNKLEVRFKEEKQMESAVLDATKKALEKEEIVEAVWPEKQIKSLQKETFIPKSYHVIEMGQKPSSSKNRPDDRRTAEEGFQLGGVEDNQAAAGYRVKESIPASSFFPDSSIPRFQIIPQKKGVEENKAESIDKQQRFEATPFTIIGQLFKSYWIVQQGERFYIIDQHAAHERILYEKLNAQSYENISQPLLVPSVLQLTHMQFDLAMENLQILKEVGFEIEEFGTLTIRVNAVPYLLGQAETPVFFYDVLNAIEKDLTSTATNQLKRDLIVQMACKHAVKAGESLDKREISALLDEYTKNGTLLTCPHGRPVMIQMSQKDLEKLFKRV